MVGTRGGRAHESPPPINSHHFRRLDLCHCRQHLVPLCACEVATESALFRCLVTDLRRRSSAVEWVGLVTQQSPGSHDRKGSSKALIFSVWGRRERERALEMAAKGILVGLFLIACWAVVTRSTLHASCKLTWYV